MLLMTELVLRIRRPVLAYLVPTSDGEQVGDLLTMNVRQHRVNGKLLEAGCAAAKPREPVLCEPARVQ